MKRPVLFFVAMLIIISFQIQAQDPIFEKKVNAISIEGKDSSKIVINKSDFKDIIEIQFSKIVTGNTFSNFGNYAAVSSTDESIKASLNFINKRGGLIDIDASGGISEGVSAFFEEGELNSNVDINISFHAISNVFNKNMVAIDIYDKEKLKKERKKQLDEDELTKINFYNNKELIDVKKKILELEDKKENILISIKGINENIKNAFYKSKLELRRDSLIYEGEKVKIDIKQAEAKLKEVSQEEYYRKKKEEVENKKLSGEYKTELDYQKALLEVTGNKDYLNTQSNLLKLIKKNEGIEKSLEEVNSELVNERYNLKISSKLEELIFEKKKIEHELGLIVEKKEEVESEVYYLDQIINYTNKMYLDSIEFDKKIKAIKPESINLTWFSYGLGWKRNEFTLFDTSLAYDDQFISESPMSYKLNFALSQFRWHSYKANSYFWSVGLNYSYTHNLSSLKTRKVTDTNVISENPSRTTTKSTDVYIGEFEEGLNEITVFGDYYQFFGVGVNKKDVVAIHINPKVKYADGQKPKSSLQLGVLIPFKKTGDEESIVNLELFYKFQDIFNTADENNNMFNRNIIGLQASFPINFFSN